MAKAELLNKREFLLEELSAEAKVERFNLMVDEMEKTIEETPRIAQEAGGNYGQMNKAGGFSRLVDIAQGLPSGRPQAS